MIDDKANIADDERNSKMSDLLQDNNLMHQALYEISEIWTGSEGVFCSTAREHYLKKLCNDMYSCAAKVLQQAK